MTCGIYQICFGTRVYIGSSNRVEQRWARHRHDFRRGVHVNRFMQRLWNKGYVPTFEVVEQCAEQMLIAREQDWVNLVHPVLNISSVVGAPMKGRSHTSETKDRMRAAQLARVDDNRGWKQGRLLTAAHKRNVGLAQPTRKIVLCVELNQQFDSVGDAARYLVGLGVLANVKGRGNIATACRGEANTAYGYTWKYIAEGVE